MSEIKVNTYFISEKIAKVRWIPEQLQECERFITGSWDMPKNNVCLWRFKQNHYFDDYNELVPQCSDKIGFSGDVSGLELITDDTVAVSCTDGFVSVLKIKRAVDEDRLEQVARSPLLHKFNINDEPAPCTAISVNGKNIATVGEDCRLNIIDAATLKTYCRTLDADDCTLLAVAYVNQQEVLTANRMGVISVFDLRTDSNPVNSFMAAGEDDRRSNYVSSLASHPTQPHILLAGSEEGSITAWDLRQTGTPPASYLSAHSGAITEIGFHRTDPNKLYSAAECGELWLWAQRQQHDQMDYNLSSGLEATNVQNINPWLNGERAKNRMNITSLISNLRKAVNSFDARGSRIICGSDTEALYFIENSF